MAKILEFKKPKHEQVYHCGVCDCSLWEFIQAPVGQINNIVRCFACGNSSSLVAKDGKRIEEI